MRLSERVLTRFAATFAANILRAIFSFTAGLVIARALGASDYGDLNFLLGSFAAINLVLDLGTSPAFYTLLARRKRGWTFFALYIIWTFGIQFFGTLAVLAVLLPNSVIQRIWLGHSRQEILLAFGVSFVLTQMWTLVNQLAEAVRKTIVVQIAAVTQAAAHLLLIVVFIRLGVLTVTTILCLLIVEYVIVATAIAPSLLRANLSSDGEQASWTSVMREFAIYCKPLLLYGVITFAYQFADRWLLQRFGGSRQQGFFSIGQQFAAISLVATTSILNVFWKEVAEAHQNGNEERASQMYYRIRRALYCFSAWLGCMLVPYARDILAVFVGADYSGAAFALALMFLYPAHQTLGQLQGTYLLAQGNTKAHAYIGIGIMLISLPVTWFLLGPLALGANGLAIKLVVLQWAAVIFQHAVITHRSGIGSDVLYQFGLLALLLAISFACQFLIHSLPVIASRPILFVMFSGVSLYILVTLPVLIRMSDIIGAGVLRTINWRRLLSSTPDASTHVA